MHAGKLLSLLVSPPFPTGSVRFWWLTAMPSLSAWTVWAGRLMTADLKDTFVSFAAFLSFLPTLALTRLKSTPTPEFFFLPLAKPPGLGGGLPMVAWTSAKQWRRYKADAGPPIARARDTLRE